MLTIEEFQAFAEEFPELADAVCLEEVILEWPIEDLEELY